MLFPKLTPRFALSFILLIIATVLSLSTFVDLNSYAESHDNNNKNISSSSSLSPSPISNGEELKKSRDAIDENTSSSSASYSSSDSSNETSDNKPQLGTLVVTKKVVNEGGSDKKPSDFTITVSGNNPTPSSFAGSSSGTTITLNPGRYSVTENLLSGYTSSMIGDCSGTIDNAGETHECTITNVYKPEDKSAQLIVITNVIDNNNDDSDLVRKPSAFTITVKGNDPLPRSFPGKSGLGVIVNLDPGRYSITEKGPSGYTTDYSDGCQGTISAGEAKACIITNEAIIPPQPTPSPVPPQPSQPLPVIETITGFSSPYGIASSLDNDLIYVSNFGQFNATGTVSVINGTTNTIVATIYVDNNPQAIAYNPANGLFYVANTYSNTLSIINGT
ncbi:MAG TPA: hypothetical protein VFY68_12405, partial [Nitrososphaeraceae archaeon]|nr:hypothetical protein [Nitrososphaeraceae archaeon]